MSEPKPLLEIQNLSFSYSKSKEKTKLLDNISFSLPVGSCTALLGNNGCGKSTLFSILAGVRKPNSGKILVDGDPFKASASHASLLGYVPQENPLIEELSAKDNLLLRFHGHRKDFERMLTSTPMQLLDIASFYKLPVKKLSGGMKRRLSLACAFSNSPRLLLLDEPCSALDFSMKRQMNDCLTAYSKEGGTILLSTHEKEDLFLCTSLLFLKDGTLKEISSDEIPY